MLLEAFHLAAAALNTYTIYYDQHFTNIPYERAFIENYPLRGRLVFLTFWCIIMQTLYFYVALLNDLLGTNAAAPKKIPFIRKFKDMYFALVCPTAIYVSSAFWTIYYIDREFILPEPIERALPVWINHVIHTLVAVNVAVEMLLTNITFPKRKVGLTMFQSLLIIYTLWLFRIYSEANAWVYPLFDVLNWFQRAAFIAVSLAICSFIYIVSEKLNYYLSLSSRRKAKGN